MIRTVSGKRVGNSKIGLFAYIFTIILADVYLDERVWQR